MAYKWRVNKSDINYNISIEYASEDGIWNSFWSPYMYAPSGLNCCALTSMQGFFYWKSDPSNWPPYEFVEEFLEKFAAVDNYIKQDLIGAVTDAQVGEKSFLRLIGILDFAIGEPAPNRVHGPHTIQILRINPTKWYENWREKHRKVYIKFVKEEHKK